MSDKREVEITGTNGNGSIEGMHSLVFALMKQLTALEDQNMIIDEYRVVVKCHKSDDVQEYDVIDKNGREIIIDKTSIDKVCNINNTKKDAYNQINMLLEEYSNRELHIWISKNNYINKFLPRFLELYKIYKGESCIPFVDLYVYDDCEAINDILSAEKFEYLVEYKPKIDSYKVNRL